ncbi:hypothetical protein GCK72_011823 [Caenorhabditis remanei]|uniref:Uncharacterized protein n=1 Tax=Caenorhabditis remanei TaxID=31234 RepID=A0A6A5H8L4_CAERE|nr:hypothetical protein GCK72_011823 [Caenorhabditis remanei]KAF1763557.1 hypothetical protein GCK72_011823 [Caenorhabditis remanei]
MSAPVTAEEILRTFLEKEKQKKKTLAVITDLKNQIEKLSNLQMANHQPRDPANEQLLKALDEWVLYSACLLSNCLLSCISSWRSLATCIVSLLSPTELAMGLPVTLLAFDTAILSMLIIQIDTCLLEFLLELLQKIRTNLLLILHEFLMKFLGELNKTFLTRSVIFVEPVTLQIDNHSLHSFAYVYAVQVVLK